MADIISAIGVFFILFAFFAGTFKILKINSLMYFIFNIIGGSLACWGSILLGSIPFTILEGTWTVVAVSGLWKNILVRET